MEKKVFFCVVLLAFLSTFCGVHAQERKTFWLYSFTFFPGYYQSEFTQVAESEHAIWYVESILLDTGYVDLSIVNTLIQDFEVTTPPADSASSDPWLNSTSGIYEKLTSVFGEPPDVDGNGKILILISSISSNYGTANLGPPIYAYFDPVDQDSTNPYSNHADMIVVSVYYRSHESEFHPVDLETTRGFVPYAFQKMLLWNRDPSKVPPVPENHFMTEGMAGFSQFVCGFNTIIQNEAKGTYYKSLSDFPSTLSLDRYPYYQKMASVYTWISYLYQLFGVEILCDYFSVNTSAGMEVYIS